MEKSKKSDQALKFLCRGLLLLVNILVFLFIIFILFHACRAFYNFGYEIYGPVVVEEAPGTDKEFSVSKGESMHKVADTLYNKGLIAKKYSFYVRTRLMDKDEIKLKPGIYTLNTSMGYEEILDILTQSE